MLADAEKIVLPGVGAFRDAIAALRQRKLVEPIRAAIEGGKPFLGICLGLQMLFDKGYEDGEHEGLGILPGEVVRFKVPAEFKVPHMGWNQVRIRRRPPIFNGIDDGAHFYFVHSYYVVPRDEFGDCYRDRVFAAVLFERLARQSVRRAVSSGEEPGGRVAVAEELRGIDILKRVPTASILSSALLAPNVSVQTAAKAPGFGNVGGRKQWHTAEAVTAARLART